MNACRNETRTSNPVRATNNKNENGKMTRLTPLTHSAAEITAKVTSTKWPASMLAKRRTASDSGRTMIVDTNSIGVTRM